MEDYLKFIDGRRYAALCASAARSGVVVHAGKPHEDDIAAVVTLKVLGIIKEYAQVSRVVTVPDGVGIVLDIDPKDARCDYVFDHHGTPEFFSSYGREVRHCALTKLWDYLGIPLEHVIGLAMRDNQGPTACPDTLGAIVQVASSCTSEQDLNDLFFSLCEEQEGIIARLIQSALINKSLVEQLRANYGGAEIVYLDQPASANAFRGTKAKIVCFDTVRGYSVTAVPPFSINPAFVEGSDNLNYKSNWTLKFKNRDEFESLLESKRASSIDPWI